MSPPVRRGSLFIPWHTWPWAALLGYHGIVSIAWLRRLPWTFWLLIGLVFLLYAPSLAYGFVSWDDELLITRNPLLRLPLFAMIGKAFTSYDPELYAPLTTFSYGLQYKAVGLWAPAYHAVSVGLHLIATGLAYVILERLTGKQRLAFASALLWAVHPLNVEAVTWISARKDLLASCFALASILAHLRDRKRWSAVLYVLGLLSKVSVVPLPFVLLLLDWHRGRDFRRSLKDQAWLFLVAAVFVVIAFMGKTRGIASLSFGDTLLLAIQSAWFYPWKLIVPVSLSILYPPSVSHAPVILSAIASIIACALVAWAVRKKIDAVSLAAGWYLLFLLPSFASFVRAGRVSVAVDHYAYLAILAPVALIVLLIDRLAKGRKTYAVIIACLSVPLAYGAYARMAEWRSSEALYASAIRLSPHEAVLHYNLGVEYSVQSRWDEAVGSYRNAIEVDSGYSSAMSNLAVLLSARGETEEARTLLEKAIALNPKNANAFNNRGSILLDAGQVDAAIADFQKAIALDDANIKAHRNLGAAYGKKGMYREGLLEFKRALELDPDADLEEIRKIERALQEGG